MHIRISILPLLVALLAGCADERKIEPSMKIYKDLGSVQCEGGSITYPEEMKKILVSAGIEVRSLSCGLDGLFHPSMCGASDGRINIFEIPKNKLQTAVSLGFKDFSGLENAREIQCP